MVLWFLFVGMKVETTIATRIILRAYRKHLPTERHIKTNLQPRYFEKAHFG